MIIEKTAVISDVHGNVFALEAVLEDIEKRSIKRIFNLGDSLFGPIKPAETAAILQKYNIISVCGNQDREIFQCTEKELQKSPTLRYVCDSLTEIDANWLKGQNETESIDGCLLFHGIPGDDITYLLNTVTEQGLRQRSDAELMSILSNFDEKVIFCGHDHLPGYAELSDGKVIINPGSVGLQAYTDDEPYDHFIETRSPSCRYSVISVEDRTVQHEKVVLKYDHEHASKIAAENGREDWAQWLNTGYA